VNYREEIAATFEPAFAALASAQVCLSVERFLNARAIDDAWAAQVAALDVAVSPTELDQ